MKIGIYIDNLHPKVGGSYTQVSDTVKTLFKTNHNNSNHTFVAIFKFKNGYIDSKYNDSNINVIYLYKNVVFSKIQIFYDALIKAYRTLNFPGINRFYKHTSIENKLKKLEIDLIISLTAMVPCFEIPYIIRVEDLEHFNSPSFPEVTQNGIWLSRQRHYLEVLARATKIIVGTQIGKCEIMRFYGIPDDRLAILPWPVQFHKKTQVSSGINLNHKLPNKYVLYPAQMWPHKNHVGLLNTIRNIKDNDGININVVFTGSDRGNLNYIKNITKELGLANQVIFLGFVSESELIYLYSNASMLIYPSLFGPDNLPPLEAFALGCPAIVHDCKGHREQYGDSAYYVDTTNDNLFAKAILKVITNNSLRNTLINNGYKRVNELTTENYVNQILALAYDFSRIRRCWGKNYSLLYAK
jgi:glycosyltransferase involved in cell wall biosynthesis